MPTTWSPTDKHTDFALSNGNLTATKQTSATWVSARATQDRALGNWYFEIIVAAAIDANSSVGIGSASANINTYPGSDVYGFAYHANGGKVNDATLTAYGAAYTVGDVIGIAVDLGQRKIWFSKNGVWQNSGNPETGTNPAFANLVASTAYYPMMGAYYPGNAMTARFLAAQLSYSPPVGFADWDNGSAVAAASVHYKTRLVRDPSRILPFQHRL